MLAANPEETSPFLLDEEGRQIEEACSQGQPGEQVTISSQWAARLIDVRRAILDEEPDIVHFCGYGREQSILFEDEQGNRLDNTLIAELFELFVNQIEGVLLHACYSPQQAQAINQHISYVIGIERDLQETIRRGFAGKFYSAFGGGASIPQAFHAAYTTLPGGEIATDLLHLHIQEAVEPEKYAGIQAQAEHFYQLGVQYLQAGMLEHVENALMKAVACNRAEPKVLRLLGQLYLDMQQWKRAIKYLEQAYQRDNAVTKPLLLQALHAEAREARDILRKMRLYDRIHTLDPDDQAFREFKDYLSMSLRQGEAVPEVELVNRPEDLIWQDELVLKFQITNKGNAPANKVRITVSASESYQIIGEDRVETNFITPVSPYEFIFGVNGHRLRRPGIERDEHVVKINPFHTLTNRHMRGESLALVEMKKFQQCLPIGFGKGGNRAIPTAATHDTPDRDQENRNQRIALALIPTKIGNLLDTLNKGHRSYLLG